MAQIYTLWNGAAPTTAARAVLLTGTAVKTHVQVHLGDSLTSRGKIIAWGASFNGDPTAVAAVDSAIVELLTTGTVPATGMVNQAVADITMLDGTQAVPTDNFPFALGTGETAYGDAAVTEGTITVTSTKDCVQVPINSWYAYQFPLDAQPSFLPAEFLRIRITSPLTIGAICYVQIEV